MQPLRDDVEARAAPGVVVVLIVANAALTAHALALEPGEAAAWLDHWGLVPRALLRGAARPGAPVWLTPLTSMFVHGSVLHLAGNALYLWIFGRRLEAVLGHARFLLFYFACGLAAAALHLASAPDSTVPAVGASGAISGLLGAYVASQPGGRLRLLGTSLEAPAALLVALWIGLQVGVGLGGFRGAGAGVAWWAHVGGFVAGAALVRSFWLRRPERSRLRI